MENIGELNEEEINYEVFKSKRALLIKTGKILAGIATGLLILGVVILIGDPEELQLFITIEIVAIIVVAATGFLNFFAFRIRPQCANCKQKTVYLVKSNQFYCKHCKKYF